MQATIGQPGPDNAKLTLGDMDWIKREAPFNTVRVLTAKLNSMFTRRGTAYGISEREVEIVLKRNRITHKF